MIFVTIGSFAPFDRLITAADELAAEFTDHAWYAQIGDGSYIPRNMDYARYLEKEEFDRAMAGAKAIIGHAGMGTISGALAANRPLLVMPRDPSQGEHVDEHQHRTAQMFEAGGHVLVAWDVDELGLRLRELFTFDPEPRQPTPESVSDRVAQFLRSVPADRRRGWRRWNPGPGSC